MSRRDTGPSRKTRDKLAERCGGRCERCGRVGFTEPHHRRMRQMGGTRRPDSNVASNLVALCRPCHRHVHVVASRAEAEADGWIVPSHGAPADTAVFTPRGRVLLSDDWTISELPAGQRMCDSQERGASRIPSGGYR